MTEHTKLEELVQRAVEAALDSVKHIDAEKHSKHHEYIDTVLKREALRTQRWNAVVEKSFAGLVWAALVGTGTAIWHYIKDHIK